MPRPLRSNSVGRLEVQVSEGNHIRGSFQCRRTDEVALSPTEVKILRHVVSPRAAAGEVAAWWYTNFGFLGDTEEKLESRNRRLKPT